MPYSTNLNRRKKFRMLLIEKDLTLAEIAKRIGKSKTAVIRTRNGDLKNKQTREKIAKVLGVKTSDLWSSE